MKWYFAAGGRDRINLLLSENVKSILVSYAYAKKGLPNELIEAHKAKGVNVMIDSGAYSNVFKPGTVTLEGYCEFLKHYAGAVTEYVTMDDMKRREVTIANMKFMWKQGLKPIVVDHVWFELKEPEFKKLYSSGAKMCWGGMVSGPGSPMGDWARNVSQKRTTPPSFFQDPKVWQGVLTRIKGRHEHATQKPVTKIHLLAVGQRLRRLIPFLDVVDSFDSSTWSLASGYGRLIMAFEGKEGAPPRLRQLAPENPPEEFLQLAAKYKLDHKHWEGRQRIAIREQKRFYGMLEDWYEENKKKGFDHLMEMSIKKSETSDEDAFAPRELLIQVPAHFEPWQFVDAVSRFEKSLAAEAERVELDLSGDEVVFDTADGRRVRLVAETVDKAVWTTAYVNGLPDSSFLYIAPGGEKDSEGKTTPRSLRFFPVKDAQGNVDLPHLRNALARIPQSNIPQAAKDAARAKAQRMLEEANKEDETEKRDVRLLPVEKADEDRNIVFGVVLEPNEVDAQGDTIDPEEIERACHLWLARYQDRGLQHEKMVNSKVEIYESYISPTDLTVGSQKVKKGTWLLMLHVLDKDLWSKIKAGDYTGFSMGGFARRVRT